MLYAGCVNCPCKFVGNNNKSEVGKGEANNIYHNLPGFICLFCKFRQSENICPLPFKPQ